MNHVERDKICVSVKKIEIERRAGKEIFIRNFIDSNWHNDFDMLISSLFAKKLIILSRNLYYYKSASKPVYL